MASKTLRYPFRVVGAAGSMVVNTVNSTVDGSLTYSKKGYKAVTENSYVDAVSKSVTKFGTDVQNRASPYTSKVAPYVTPYAKQASPYVKPALLAMVALAIPAILCVLGFIALITSPIWVPIAFFTSLLWIPLAIVVGLVALVSFLAIAFVASVRYFTMTPKGKKMVTDVWRTISTPSVMQKILYVPA
eukprot:CAMPEP_0196735562 /NCGR_PEP_ID=MMETSP1091-20130531/13960_1 /TAXON_ID=302021 /ORGANISM="Rhodomonas sp., Strain CCMP768" /LENGTH=187 /DNA_ID=CAMNT_0042079213 /DNA_START=63 /DNA_END=626 /DNA_ORIENTATION=+